MQAQLSSPLPGNYLQYKKQFIMKTIQKKSSIYIILNKIVFFTLASILVMQISSCKKNEKVLLSVRMTDAPANYEEVNIDVQGVEITDGDEENVMLTTTAGIYNLLDLSNGVNIVLASGYLDAGKVSQIRLILGTENTVKVDGVVYPLSTPSAMQSGLKLKLNETFEAGIDYTILLDFDANQSIVLKGNNEYQLKPVIRTIDEAISGSIKGSVSPVVGMVMISATSNGITYATVTNSNGYFLIAGLPIGTYDITVTPALPLLPVTLNGKTVVVGVPTDLGIVVIP